MPADYLLRLIRTVVDEALDVLSPEFDRLYARVGRPGVAPEKLLRALLLQAFYSVHSERQLMEQTVLFPVVALSISTVFEGYRWDLVSLAGLC